MKEILNNFKSITGYDLASYLKRYADFVENYQQNVLDYYGGLTDNPDSTSFNELKYLTNQKDIVDQIFIRNKEDFPNFSYWDLIDMISDISTAIDTVNNSGKWQRSAVTSSSFSNKTEVSVTLRAGQTLENLAKELGYDDPDNDWIDIAQRNNLQEEDYDPDDNKILSVSFQNTVSITINTIIDNIQGESVLGLDIQRGFEFEDDDLKTLSYKQTIEQAFKIILNLMRGDIPEFPNDGLQRSLVVGTNVGSLSYPSIFRQIFQSFAKDDTFSKMTIDNIEQKEGSVWFTVGVQDRLNDFHKDKIVV